MVEYVRANEYVICAVLVFMWALQFSAEWPWGTAVLQKTTADSAGKLAFSFPSARLSFWFFFAMFACFLAEYLVGDIHENLSGDQQRLWHPLIHVASAIAGNLASVCMFLAGFAYVRGVGDALDRTLVRQAVIGCIVFTAVWSIGFEIGGHDKNAFATACETAPVLLLAAVAGTALGWSFVIRWGKTGLPFLLVSVLYALLQLPAYIRGEFGYLNDALGNAIRSSNLDLAYSFLAGGKILLAFGFLSLLCGSASKEVKIAEPKYWPTESLPPPASWHRGWGWIASIVTGFLVGAATEPLSGPFLIYLGLRK